MARNQDNIIPVSLAVLLHVIVFGSLLVAFDWSQAHQRLPPLAIKATLIVDELPAVIEIPDEPEPALPEPEPRPDPDEQARVKAEEAKRLADLKAEQERQARIERQQREEAERKAREEAERKAREEAEREKRLAEMERQRQEEIERQRRENEEEERRAMEAQRLAMLEAEQKAMELANSTEMQVYQTMLQQKIKRQWARPGTTPDNLSCVVVVQQRTGGVIWDARISECNTSDPIVRRSILAAVNRSSPLPQPKNPLLFLSSFEVEFTHND